MDVSARVLGMRDVLCWAGAYNNPAMEPRIQYAQFRTVACLALYVPIREGLTAIACAAA